MEYVDKRLAVMQAAMELVAENGFHGSPMSMVAKRAGVATGTIYHYFESKDTLILDTYAHLEGQLLAAITETYPGDRPVQERFMHIGCVLVGNFLSSPLLFRFIEQFHNSPYGVDTRRDRVLGKKNDIVTRLFEESMQQQVIKELPLPMLFALTFGPLLQISRDHIFGLIELNERLIEEMVSACWDALKR